MARFLPDRTRVWHLIGFTLLVLAVVGAFVIPVEEKGPVDWFARRASNEINEVFQAAGIIALLIAAFVARSRGAATLVAIVMLGVTAAAHLLKLATGPMLPRPTGSPGGFPSAHATATCALAYLLTEKWPRGAPLWYGVAAIISWSRWEAHGHYPYQILAGVALGLGLAYVLTRRFGPSEASGVAIAAGVGAEGKDPAG